MVVAGGRSVDIFGSSSVDIFGIQVHDYFPLLALVGRSSVYLFTKLMWNMLKKGTLASLRVLA